MYELARAFGPIAAILVFAGAVLLHRRIYRFKYRPATHVIPYLRAVNPEEVADLLSPAAEHYLRLNLTKNQFQSEQRRRLWLALEYLRRLAHNGLIMAEWGHYELKRTRNEGERETCLELVSSSVHVRMGSFVVRARIHVWLARMALFPFLAPPSVERLAEMGSTELLGFYRSMRAAAMQVSLFYGQRYCEEMIDVL